jgi:hypothetical protein
LFSNRSRYRSCESLFFPLNINVSHLVPYIEINAVLIENEPVYSVSMVSVQVPALWLSSPVAVLTELSLLHAVIDKF